MPWVRVDDGLFLHPKWLATPANGRALWVTALSYCGNQANGGQIPEALLPMLGGDKLAADQLVESGLWERTNSGYSICKFADYNPTSTPESKAERAEIRSRAGRKAGLASATKRQRTVNDDSTIDQRTVNDDPTIDQRLTNDQSTIDQRFSTPIPSPIPSPSPTPIYTDRLDGNTPRARETPTDSRTYRQQQRGLTARPAVRTLDSELDRPEPRRYESATEARIRRALELDERINGEADRKELESIAEYFTQEKK
jgi:hypothetical protein